MNAPEILNENEMILFRKLYDKLMAEAAPKMQPKDFKKFYKIHRNYIDNGIVTKAQYKAFRHYCRVYNISLENSLDFILSD